MARTLLADVTAHLDWLRMRNYSPSTISGRRVYLEQFCAWCDERSLALAGEITRPILERYRHHLYTRRKSDGRPLSFRSQYLALHALRMFFRWLVREGHIDANPASELEMPKLDWRLPRTTLTAEEAELVLHQPNLLDPLGLRDRAILEVFYSTAIRRMELVNLLVWDVDSKRGTLFIREGKGRRDRVVPISERALTWVERYRQEVRPLLVWDDTEDHLFLTKRGEPMTPTPLGADVARYVDAANLGKKGSCHLWRHTCATLMLEGGADVRFVQEMLGHASIQSTQVYTKVSIAKLKQVHAATHPGALPQLADVTIGPADDDVAAAG
ncbi:MAG TPA: site-specific tyrosine recombinase XerC [Dehalococcoidia bacterium]|nr:site-specific tyrosine recombinase XerC [Dehalococcoidia bacterium]